MSKKEAEGVFKPVLDLSSFGVLDLIKTPFTGVFRLMFPLSRQKRKAALK